MTTEPKSFLDQPPGLGNLSTLSIYFLLFDIGKAIPTLPIYLKLLGKSNEKCVASSRFENCQVLLLLRCYYSTMKSGYSIISPKRFVLFFIFMRKL